MKIVTITFLHLQTIKKKREDHTSPNENIEQDKQTAREVAQAIRDLGWELASTAGVI